MSKRIESLSEIKEPGQYSPPSDPTYILSTIEEYDLDRDDGSSRYCVHIKSHGWHGFIREHPTNSHKTKYWRRLDKLVESLKDYAVKGVNGLNKDIWKL